MAAETERRSAPPQSLAVEALGAGLGFRPPFLADLFRRRSEVDFLEITADHYFGASPEKRDELDLLAAHFPLIPHGLDLSLGSAEGIDAAYLDRLAAVVERISPPWWSEHLAFTRAGGVSIGHLAALPFTHEAVDAVARNVETVRRVIKAPLILENITVAVQVPGGVPDRGAAANRLRLALRRDQPLHDHHQPQRRPRTGLGSGFGQRTGPLAVGAGRADARGGRTLARRRPDRQPRISDVSRGLAHRR